MSELSQQRISSYIRDNKKKKNPRHTSYYVHETIIQAGRQAGWMRRVGVSLCGTVTRLLGRMPRAHALRAPGLSAAARWKRRQSEAPVRSCIFKPRGEIKHPFGPAERRNRPPRGHFWPVNRTAEGSAVCFEDGGKAAESHLRASLTCLLFGRGGRVASRRGRIR